MVNLVKMLDNQKCHYVTRLKYYTKIGFGWFSLIHPSPHLFYFAIPLTTVTVTI